MRTSGGGKDGCGTEDTAESGGDVSPLTVGREFLSFGSQMKATCQGVR